MNYRHTFHAGNFADLVKHAGVLHWLAMLQGAAPRLQIIDTHAGAGAYDLEGEAAVKSGEARAGIARLMADAAAPPAFDALKSAVRALNPSGGARLYPGSPLLIAKALRPDDRYLGCELRPDDHALLSQTLAPHRNAASQKGDGYAAASGAIDAASRPLVLIDPPFEAADDYPRIVQTTAAVLARRNDASLAIWTPLKDLETFDALLRGLEPHGALTVAEARLRPLTDPMKMNGCAMLFINPPLGLTTALDQIVQWVAANCGGQGAAGKVWTLGG